MTTHADTFGGPYVAAAVICEKVLHDKDGVLSLIRIVDRVTINASGPDVSDEMPPMDIPPDKFSLVVTLKSGSLNSAHTISIRTVAPSGRVVFESSVQVLFEGEDRGVNVIAPFAFKVEQSGLYWLDVLCDGLLLTRVPFRFLYQRLSIRPGAGA